MFPELFKAENYEWGRVTEIDEIKIIVNTYIDKYYDATDDKDTWFNKIKELTEELGYASNMKDYKKNPEMYKGNVADISTVIRVCLTTKSRTPDLYDIMRILGIDEIKRRINLL